MSNYHARLFPPSLRTWHCVAVLFLAVFSAYMNTLGHDFVGFDDAVLLDDRSGSWAGPRALRFWALRAADDPLSSPADFFMKRQMRNLSLAADKALFGEDLWGHHLSNIAHHFVAACLAFLIAAKLLGARGGTGGPLAAAPSASGAGPRCGYGGPLAAALLFALHPVQTESVAYLGGRRDLLCGVFTLASFFMFLLAVERGKKFSLLCGAGLLWAAALGTKQSAVALPAFCAAYLWVFRPAERGRMLRGHWGWLLGAALVCAAFIVLHVEQAVAFAARQGLPREALWYGGSFLTQWTTEPGVLLHAVRLVFWPSILSGDYSYRVFDPGVSLWEALPAWTALAGLGAAAWLVLRKRPVALFAAAWAALAYAPTLPLLPTVHNLEVFAEHWLYLPVLGAALAAACVFLRVRERSPRAAGLLLAAVLAAAFTRTVVRNRDWKDDLSFWSKTAETYPSCARALAAQGLVLYDRGRIEEAERLYGESLKVKPDYPQTRINLASLYSATGRRAQAEKELEEVLRLPFGRSHERSVWHNLGVLYLDSGRNIEAYRAFKASQDTGLGIGPLAQYGLIHAWLKLDKPPDRYGELEEMYRHVLVREPRYAPVLNDLGLLLITEGRHGEAVPLLKRALERDPGFVNARINLGLALTGQGEFVSALTELKRVSQTAPLSEEAWIALSQLNRKWGKLPQALAAAKRGVALSGSRRAYGELLEVKRDMVFGRMRRGR